MLAIRSLLVCKRWFKWEYIHSMSTSLFPVVLRVSSLRIAKRSFTLYLLLILFMLYSMKSVIICGVNVTLYCMRRAICVFVSFVIVGEGLGKV
jgi:hypothetical protein